jgi:two-component system sensor histidine kinase KdpD
MIPLAKEKHQRIIGELLEKMPIMSVKRKAFLGAVENLIMQALELAPQATTISLFGRYDGKVLFLRLITEGPGMPDEDVIEIFDRTWCTEPNRRYTARTALGLYTNKKLTSVIGATIECISSPMQGSTVEMTLPVVPVALENGEYLEEQI